MKTPRASTSNPVSFLHNYISPRKHIATSVILPDVEDIDIPTQKAPEGVLVEENLLEQLYKIQFVNHDITNEEKFLELVNSKYMETRHNSHPNAPIIVELQTWKNGLMKSRILNLLEIHHFGRTM